MNIVCCSVEEDQEWYLLVLFSDFLSAQKIVVCLE